MTEATAPRQPRRSIQAQHASLSPSFNQGPCMRPNLLSLCLLLAATAPAWAADGKPEIDRPVAPPQATGVAHTLRQIPEACARFEGTFTGDAAQPYNFKVVRISAQCQPRARLMDAAKVKPDGAQGWKLNDVVRIPSKACPSQVAVLTIWRHPVAVSTPDKDGQGQARIYLEDAQKDIAAGKVAQAKVPLYAAEFKLEGKACP